MLKVNRPLAFGDFRAITEALHRRFRGTWAGNVRYVERGYNTVHSYATKGELYKTVLNEVFPEESADNDAQ